VPECRRGAQILAIAVLPREAGFTVLLRTRALPGRRKTTAYIVVVENKRPLQSIPDDDLLRRLAELMGQSRRLEADIVAHIAEVDERRLYSREAFPSMFAYCTDVLHLSEAEAYLRICAARASREHPKLLTMPADGRLHLTGIAKLAPHLTRENRDGILERATHRSKRQIEEQIAEIAPRPDVREMVRKLPERKALESVGQGPAPMPMLELRPDGVAAPAMPVSMVSPPVVQPLSPGRYKVQFTASAELQQKLERLQALDRLGRRCPGRNRLQFHHRQPFGLGGNHSLANIRLMCRAHNAYLAECDYGREAMARRRRSRSRVAPATVG
jgi:hypothetical protein